MSDAEVAVLEERLKNIEKSFEDFQERASRLLDGNGDGAMSRIFNLEKQWESRLVAEAEARRRISEDYASGTAEASDRRYVTRWRALREIALAAGIGLSLYIQMMGG